MRRRKPANPTAMTFSEHGLALPILLLAAYLLGSIPFAVLSSRLFGLADPRSYGSGNPGATNVLRTGNKAAAAVTLIGDAAKGALAVGIGLAFGVSGTALVAIGLAAFLGHLFSLFLRFKGGKGVATAAGVLLAIDWRLGAAVVAVWLATAAITRYSSLAALIAALASPLLAWLITGAGTEALLLWSAMSAALILKHRGNVVRLLAGEESRIGGKS
jgi:glycerol-3-phosphate acyltransferase PlsY